MNTVRSPMPDESPLSADEMAIAETLAPEPAMFAIDAILVPFGADGPVTDDRMVFALPVMLNFYGDAAGIRNITASAHGAEIDITALVGNLESLGLNLTKGE